MFTSASITLITLLDKLAGWWSLKRGGKGVKPSWGQVTSGIAWAQCWGQLCFFIADVDSGTEQTLPKPVSLPRTWFSGGMGSTGSMISKVSATPSSESVFAS